jgi:hypothetical protein
MLGGDIPRALWIYARRNKNDDRRRMVASPIPGLGWRPFLNLVPERRYGTER